MTTKTQSNDFNSSNIQVFHMCIHLLRVYSAHKVNTSQLAWWLNRRHCKVEFLKWVRPGDQRTWTMGKLFWNSNFQHFEGTLDKNILDVYFPLQIHFILFQFLPLFLYCLPFSNFCHILVADYWFAETSEILMNMHKSVRKFLNVWVSWEMHETWSVYSSGKSLH